VEPLSFVISLVMPVCDKAQLLQISFVEDCLYVLPKCFPIVDFALLSKRCLILIQASVLSLSLSLSLSPIINPDRK